MGRGHWRKDGDGQNPIRQGKNGRENNMITLLSTPLEAFQNQGKMDLYKKVKNHKDEGGEILCQQ